MGEDLRHRKLSSSAPIDEAKGEHAPALEKLKKSELAIRAESLVAGTSWLPQAIRIAANDDAQVLVAE